MRTGQGADPKIAGSRLPLLLTLPNAPTIAAYTAAGFSGDETIPTFYSATDAFVGPRFDNLRFSPAAGAVCAARRALPRFPVVTAFLPNRFRTRSAISSSSS